VYGVVNLSSSDAAALKDFSRFISQVTTKGQVPGTQLGQLPPGYAPLPSALAGQAQASAAAIAAFVPLTTDTSGTGAAQDDYLAGAASNVDGAGTPSGIGASMSSAPVAATGRTPDVKSVPAAQMALTGSLATGLAGALFAPFFFRGRRLG
jgi:hypothetical protein